MDKAYKETEASPILVKPYNATARTKSPAGDQRCTWRARGSEVGREALGVADAGEGDVRVRVPAVRALAVLADGP